MHKYCQNCSASIKALVRSHQESKRHDSLTGNMTHKGNAQPLDYSPQEMAQVVWFTDAIKELNGIGMRLQALETKLTAGTLLASVRRAVEDATLYYKPEAEPTRREWWLDGLQTSVQEPALKRTSIDNQGKVTIWREHVRLQNDGTHIPLESTFATHNKPLGTFEGNAWDTGETPIFSWTCHDWKGDRFRIAETDADFTRHYKGKFALVHKHKAIMFIRPFTGEVRTIEEREDADALKGAKRCVNHKGAILFRVQHGEQGTWRCSDRYGNRLCTRRLARGDTLFRQYAGDNDTYNTPTVNDNWEVLEQERIARLHYKFTGQ